MLEFKPGDRVRMLIKGDEYGETYYATGEITIVREDDCKVLFDGEYDFDYSYYKKEDLELITSK